MSTRVLAADLGATSVRVCSIDLDDPANTLRVVHRVEHSPVDFGRAGVRWDWSRICDEIEHGLRLGLQGGPVASIGIDTWGVDYGLLGADGRLLSAPHAYRSSRTDSWRATRNTIGAQRLYEIAGLQELPFNTVFQLAVHDRAELESARHLLMLPQLLAHRLTGAGPDVLGERTSAGTTAMVDVATGDWSEEICQAIGVDRNILPTIQAEHGYIGAWNGIPVHSVAGHDTASAVAALPAEPIPGAAFVATGTWFLVGSERELADTSEAARLANFTNEPGAISGYRFLKNVPGLWLLEQCRAVWGGPSVAELVLEALALKPGPVVDVHHESLVAPTNMDTAIRDLAGIPAGANRNRVVRCVVDSLLAATAEVLQQLVTLRGYPLTEIHMLGGGTRISVLPSLLSEHLGVPVHVGSAEATALGNALVQGIALGRYGNLSEARKALQS